MHSDSVVIIPTYNEKENIEKIIRAIFALPKCFHILVIEQMDIIALEKREILGKELLLMISHAQKNGRNIACLTQKAV